MIHLPYDGTEVGYVMLTGKDMLNIFSRIHSGFIQLRYGIVEVMRFQFREMLSLAGLSRKLLG